MNNQQAVNKIKNLKINQTIILDNQKADRQAVITKTATGYTWQHKIQGCKSASETGNFKACESAFICWIAYKADVKEISLEELEGKQYMQDVMKAYGVA